MLGKSVLLQMPTRYGAIYNNCQNFAIRFLEDIIHGVVDKQNLTELELRTAYRTVWDPLELMGRQIILIGYGLG